VQFYIILPEILTGLWRPAKSHCGRQDNAASDGLFDPFLHEFVEMHYLMTDPLIVDDAALQQLLGGMSKTPYPEGVRQSLAALS
jgi:hypothetical protein